MIELAYLVMISFLIFSPILFWVLSPQQALVAVFLVSLTCLPQIDFEVPFLRHLSHDNIPCICALVGIAISGKLRSYRFSLTYLDIPVLVAPFLPFASALANGFGAYDAAAELSQYSLRFSIPFLLGRSLLASSEGSNLLARGYILAALVYIIPCLIEIRLSPQLHYWFYGSSFYAGERLGGYRPSVFMKTGLQLGIWMSSCAFVALCCYQDPFRNSDNRLISGRQFWAIFIVNLMCRSTGALAILAMGIAAVIPVIRVRSRVGLIGLLLISPVYMTTRLTGMFDGKILIELSANIDASRASSLKTRIDNEDQLMVKALKKPVVGWGGWGDARLFDENGNNISLVDGRWIGVLGSYGLTCLFCEYWTLLLPLMVTIKKWPTVLKCRQNAGAMVAISCACAFFAINFLSNNQPDPFYWLCAGAISGRGTFSPTTSEGADGSTTARSPRVRRSLQFAPHARPRTNSEV